ncbi:MAG: hypothetical protein AB1430_03880 [Pseudomonadota bacterium]
MSRWQLALALLAAAAYAALSHALMLNATAEPWAVAALLGPLLGVTGLVAWRGRQWGVLGGVGVAAAVLGGVVAQGGVEQVSRLYVLQHVGIHLALGAGFGLSLRDEVSLIGRVARTVHQEFTPALAGYTRGVTAAWTAYFFGMSALSLWVYAFGSWSAWSLLANVITPAAIGALFVGEHLLRYRLHPEFERVSLAEAVRAYRRATAAQAVGR